jgi:hypothetical protein
MFHNCDFFTEVVASLQDSDVGLKKRVGAMM